MVRCMHMQKVDFLMTRVYVVFPFFLAKQIYLLARRKKKTTGPDKSVNLKKEAINCILMKNQRFEGKLSRSR